MNGFEQKHGSRSMGKHEFIEPLMARVQKYRWSKKTKQKKLSNIFKYTTSFCIKLTKGFA